MSNANLWIVGVASLGFAVLTGFMALAHRPMAAIANALFCVATLFFLWALLAPDYTKWIGLAVAGLAGAYATWRALENKQ